jgi:hypothetical protein
MFNRQKFDKQLEQFRITDQHGSQEEKDLFPLVANEFPNYEIFWRRYIVPCTYRIDPSAMGSIRIRPDAKRFEKMAMSHYSTFFYFAHATRALGVANSYELLANIVFFLLDSSIDNLELFLKQIKEISSDFGQRVKLGQPRNGNDFITQISDYRNTLAHNPVLGRAVNHQGLEMLPIHRVLKKVERSWLEIEKLTENEFRETREVIEELRRAYAAYLNKKWADVLECMDNRRDEFLSLLRIPDGNLIIPAKAIAEIIPRNAFSVSTISSTTIHIGGVTTLGSGSVIFGANKDSKK